MISKTINSLDIDFEVQVPSSVEEFNQNAWKAESGTGNPCLNEAIQNILYRSYLAGWRATFLNGDSDLKVPLAGLEALFPDSEFVMKLTADDKGLVSMPGLDDITGVARKTTKDGEKEVYSETESKFFVRLCAETSKTAADYVDWAKFVAAQMKFDASAAVRGPATPKKTAKEYLAAADAIMSQGLANEVAAKLSSALGIPVTSDREGLGKGISLFEAKKRAEERKKLANSYIAMAQS